MICNGKIFGKLLFLSVFTILLTVYDSKTIESVYDSFYSSKRSNGDLLFFTSVTSIFRGCV